MRIEAVEIAPATVPLTRPYAVATRACDTASLVSVRLVAASGPDGLGAATPEPEVTGETFALCLAALEQARTWLPGQCFDEPADLAAMLRARLPGAPGARAAIDIALHDLWGKTLGKPVVDLLGRVHSALPTSVTIGVRDVAATLAEAEEHLGNGFRVLKIKIGVDLDLDVERLARLRERFGPALPLLVDANTGYTFAQLQAFLARTRSFDLRLVEQPLPPAASRRQSELGADDVRRLCADESLHDAADARALAGTPRAFGAFNIKLMKCGGVTEALAIARIAADAGIDLLWGCMDESRIGIAAALHAAFAAPATRHLDLDGSFDLARDVAAGGFLLQDGVLRTLDAPGLGATALD